MGLREENTPAVAAPPETSSNEHDDTEPEANDDDSNMEKAGQFKCQIFCYLFLERGVLFEDDILVFNPRVKLYEFLLLQASFQFPGITIYQKQ